MYVTLQSITAMNLKNKIANLIHIIFIYAYSFSQIILIVFQRINVCNFR